MAAQPVVRDLMSSPARCVRAEDSLFVAAELMWGGDCGGVPVVDGDGKLAGFVTDRDIAMCAAIQGRTLHELPVSAAMTFGGVGVPASARLGLAHTLLCKARVRRLPVQDQDGVVIGVLSLADLVRDAADQPKSRSKWNDLRTTFTAVSLQPDLAASSSSAAADPGAATKATTKSTAKPASKAATKAKKAPKVAVKAKPARKQAAAKRAAPVAKASPARRKAGRSASAGA